MRKTYRVWMNPQLDAALMAHLETLPNKAAFIHRALENFAQVNALGKGEPKQYQVHVTDPGLQAYLDTLDDGHQGAALRRACWLQMGRAMGLDVEELATKIVQDLLEAGWTAAPGAQGEQEDPQLAEFLDQF